MIHSLCLFKNFNYVSANHSDQAVWKSSVSELSEYYYGSRTVNHVRLSVVMKDMAPEHTFFIIQLSEELACNRNDD